MFSKKMITLLVLLAVLVSGTAMAGDYTIYGKLHMSMDYHNDSEDSQLILSSNTSRFGVKGSTEINEDYTMIWQFENLIDLAKKDDSFHLANRNSYLGLKAGWGTFLYGIHDTPFKTVSRKVELFPEHIGDSRQTLMQWDRRLDDVLVYVTPDLSGFTGVLGYQLAKGTIGEEDKSAMSFSGTYAKDALWVSAAYETVQKNRFLDADTNPEPEAAVGIRVGAKYTTDEFKVVGLFQSLTDNGGMKDLKATTMGGGAAYQFMPKYWGKAQVFLADPNTDVDDDEYTLMTFGIDYNVVKSFTIYLDYAMMSNGDASCMGLNDPYVGHGVGVSPTMIPAEIDGDDPTVAVGETVSTISVGMIKTF